MSLLRHALSRFDLREIAVLFPQNPTIRFAGRKFFEPHPAGPSDDAEASAARIVTALEAGESLDPRLWALSPWRLWRTRPAIAENPRAFDRFAACMEGEVRPEMIRTLATVYLVQFDPAAPRLQDVSDLLGRIVPREGGRHAALHERLGLFALPEGPKRLLACCLAAGRPLEATLKALGFTAQERRGGFMRLVHDGGLAAFRLRHLVERDEDSLKAVAAWSQDSEGALLFPEAVPAFADALVAPFVRTRHPPEMKRAILALVLRHLGVPGPDSAPWAGTDPAARRTIGRWLAERSLAQFFDIVDEAAYRDHWDYRRAFWTAYGDAGHIDAAWVAFAPRGARKARSILGEDAQFAELVRGSRKAIEPGHAVLMLKLGAATLTDWSHRGACHIWGPSDGAPPLLYRPRYSADDLMHPDRGRSERVVYHTGSAEYFWQRRVAAIIRDLTGIAMPEAACRVGR